MLEQEQPVVHQVEGDVLAVAEVKHLGVADCDGAAGGGDVAGWAVQDAVMGAGEGALLNGDIAGDMQGVDLDVRVPGGQASSSGSSMPSTSGQCLISACRSARCTWI